MKAIFEIPNPVEYCDLRVAAGLSPKGLEAATAGLSKSLYAVCLRDNGRLIGMGRVVGDGLHVQVVDIAVHPDFQGKGLGRVIMECVMEFLRLKIDSTATVSLFADNDWLYQKFGFYIPSNSQGMFLKR